MIEVEIKARADHFALLRSLKAAGAKYERTVMQNDSYYNAPHRDFGQTDEALRLREENGTVYLTYKGKKIDPKSKARKEVEVTVSDRSKAEDLFLSLGFQKTLGVVKKRGTYKLRDVEVCVDSVEGLGDFVEMEILAPDLKDVPRVRDHLIEEMRSLGITGDLIRESYLEMLLALKKPTGL
jgi:adenylate cyclase, class 2